MKYTQSFQNIDIAIDLKEMLNYVAVHNGDMVCSSFCIKNTSTRKISNISVRVEGYFFPAEEFYIESIAAHASVELEHQRIRPSIDRLYALSDTSYADLKISVSNRSKEIASFVLTVEIQPLNHWRAYGDALKDLASFVMPEHDYVYEIMSKASDIMNDTCNDRAIRGSQADSIDEIKAQIDAVWRALASEDISYLTLYDDLIQGGQNIRTIDKVRQHKQGNCMDLSLLLCSCFERMNLYPVLVFVHNHVMAGVRLKPTKAGNVLINQDKEYLTKTLTDKHNDEILFLETTLLRDRNTSLEKAHDCAVEFVKQHNIKFIFNVMAARKMGIRPLPYSSSYNELVKREHMELKGGEAANNSSRRDGWERRLLDLSLRNPMLNLHPGKNILPIREKDIKEILNSLKANKLTELVGEPNIDITENLKSLYRTSRTNLEENGANTLFVAIGTLRWFDVDDTTPHYAPLIFIPAVIVRKRAMTYEIRPRDDDPMINVTLLEMMRQMFGTAITELDSVPLDADEFPDWKRIINIFGEHIKGINEHQPSDLQWELPVESYVGIFSFSKYLMWRDIHTHPAVLASHPILRGFLDGFYHKSKSEVDAGMIESRSHSDYMLPIDYDSSQLEAVAECHSGNSFVLHGPPGTGKSQTITNMIADAIYNGKRVLFVAEKKAALDVVRQRLDKIGLSPYCLELHSNKTDKRSFFGQISDSKLSLLASEGNSSASSFASDRRIERIVQKLRNNLNDITESLHSVRKHELSLYDCLCKSLEGKYTDLVVKYEEIQHLSPLEIEKLCDKLSDLDIIVERILGFHPSDSPLLGLYPKLNTSENQQQIISTLFKLPESIAKARKKARGWVNRWFFRKTAEELLDADVVWQELTHLVRIGDGCADNIDTLEDNIKRWSQAVDSLRQWYHFSVKMNSITKYDVPSGINFYLDHHSGSETAQRMEIGYYQALADHAIDSESCLRGFNGTLNNKSVDKYIASIENLMEYRRHELLAEMERKIQNARLSHSELKQLSLLKNRMLKNGRGVALRKIISDSESVIQKMFPCMLMSPLSVAQYLDMRNEMFDVVIFDEASQMETADAVGSIARGKSLVVVGDPQQLPPTRFFSTSFYGEELEESEDADSILEDCIGLELPERYLSRHYRSHHESLIAFSNHHFYEDRLLTFPSNNDAARKVKLIDPEGIYDFGKTRTNRIEAEAVVEHIIELLKSREEAPSIGVVAFSKAQSNLIEDILNAKLSRRKVLQQKLDEANEQLFIKNLENVQGDERDIIIFSIGYGPAKNGYVSLNFGPLNQSKGERRLNVAVSRAREEMIIFSSLKANHIPEEGIASKGVMALRQFLKYASDNSENKRTIDSASQIDAIIQDIARSLRERGKEVRTQIGRSSFKVDIAVVDPDNPDNFLFGIIVDGRNYASLPTVRDREVTIPKALKNLGWKIKRIWVIDWIENPKKVLDSLE